MAEHTHTGPDTAAGTDSNDDDGFTLIELMVVVLVIAILLAIAIPTFLGARERSQDRAAQSNLRNVLTAAKVLFVDEGDYTQATTAKLSGIEPGLAYVGSAAASASETSISVEVSGTGDTVFSAAALSDSGTCWLIKDDSDTAGAGGGTQYNNQITGTCNANAAKALTANLRTFPT